jgi:hypothetical protein
MKAYKYTKKEFVDGLLKQGIIKVGTISEYRKYDHPEIGDSGEGSETIITTASSSGEKITEENMPVMPYPIRKAVSISGSAEFHLHGKVILRSNHSLPDAYIYCVTQEPSESVMQQFGADCCVEISDVEAFCKIVCEEVLRARNLSFGQYICRSCQYVGREIIDDAYEGVANIDVSAYFLKESKYSPQKEARMLFLPLAPSSVELPTLLLTCPELADLCSLYTF